MSDVDSSIHHFENFLRTLPEAFGVDLKIHERGALIEASVGCKTQLFIPLESCSSLPRRDDLSLEDLGVPVECSTNLRWTDMMIPLRRLGKSFELAVAAESVVITESNSTKVFTRGLFLIFQ